MLPSTLLQKELLEDLRGRKALVMKFLLPLVLLSPLLLERVPPHVRAGGMAVAVLFTGAFGSAVGLVQLRDSKMLERLAALPLSPSRLVSEYLLANALFDGVQLLAPLALIAFSGHPRLAALAWPLACYVMALLAANALGVLVALVSGSSGEVHLYAALTVLLVGGLSGVFTPSMPGLLESLSLLSPFRHLADVLLYAWGQTSPHLLALPLFSTLALLLVIALLAPRLFKA